MKVDKMTKTEAKKIDKHNELLLQAKNRLIDKGYQKAYKEDIDMLLSFVRPEHMTNGTFNNKCDEIRKKYINDSKNNIYDQYEKEIIENTASSIFEFQMKAYLTMCYY